MATSLWAGDSARTRIPYRSDVWAVCAVYPSNWEPEESSSGELLRLTSELPELEGVAITLTGFRNLHHHGGDARRTKDWDEILDDATDALRDNLATNIHERHQPATIGGFPAMISDLTWTQDGVAWRSHMVRVRRPDEVVAELELRAPAARFQRARAVYDAVLRSAQFSCLPDKPAIVATKP